MSVPSQAAGRLAQIGPRSPQRRTRRADDPRRTLGARGEQLAAEHLQRLGFAVLARNVRTRAGEIDLIACDRRTLVFVEVKARRLPARAKRPAAALQPLAWLRPSQRLRLRRLAGAWLAAEHRPRPTARTIRFDAVGVVLDEHDRLLRLDHIESAW